MVDRHPDTGKLLLWFTTSTGCRATCNITKSVKEKHIPGISSLKLFLMSGFCCVFISRLFYECHCVGVQLSINLFFKPMDAILDIV